MDAITIQDKSTLFIPVIKSEFDSNYIKHVICEGASFHVLCADSERGVFL